jgi:hypothetical protein
MLTPDATLNGMLLDYIEKDSTCEVVKLINVTYIDTYIIQTEN